MKDSSDRSAEKLNARKSRKIVGISLFLAFFLLFAFLGTRLLVIAVGKNVKNVNLNDRAEKLYTQTQTLKARRGLFMMQTEIRLQKIPVHIRYTQFWTRVSVA